MANRKELRDARRKANEAVALLHSIEALPRRVGQSVRWSKGVVWTRAGDDDWRPNTSPDERYSSAHVARFQWEPYTPVESSDG